MTEPLSVTLPAAPGAYILWIDLPQPLTVAVARRAAATLAPGRYAYCGSARGPGGIRARVARHLRAEKRPHWHIDRLTGVGRVVAVHGIPDGSECDLADFLAGLTGVSAPVPGFGSSDCRRCTSHLLAVPADLPGSLRTPPDRGAIVAASSELLEAAFFHVRP